MDRQKLREKLNEMVFEAKRDGRYDDEDALRECVGILDEAKLERTIPNEENGMLIRRFVGSVGYDYIRHKEKNTAQIHPDFSEDTKILWEEIESRLTTPKCMNFNKDAALAEIAELKKRQDGILSGGGISYDSSWRVGIIHGLNDARRVIEKYMEVKNDS